MLLLPCLVQHADMLSEGLECREVHRCSMFWKYSSQPHKIAVWFSGNVWKPTLGLCFNGAQY